MPSPRVELAFVGAVRTTEQRRITHLPANPLVTFVEPVRDAMTIHCANMSMAANDLGHDWPSFYQVEVEYLHSRTRDEAARHAVETELMTVRNAAAAYLDLAGIAHRPGESKLSYLRSLTAMEKQ